MRIRCYPDPVLTQPAAEVTEIDGRLVEVCREMLQAMHEAAGIGLAGPQVGLSRRVLVLNLAGGEPQGEIAVVNPVVLERHDVAEVEEGCLSFPGLYSKITRSAKVVVKAYDLNGREVQFAAEGLAARLWQHEIDHLDGVLLINRMTPTRRLGAARRLKELERDYEQVLAESGGRRAT